MGIDWIHHDSTTAAVTECGHVSCSNCQRSRKTNAGWYCARLQRVVNLDGCIYFSQKVALKPKPITNADRIRQMTDEELADWVWGAETAGRAYGPRGKKSWLDWLNLEVKEGE